MNTDDKKVNTVICGNCLEVLKTLLNNSVDSVVTDPPYELGFMGKTWDNSGIANNPELWKEVLRVLKPGGHLLSFSGTRTYHRQAVAIEDAGFEIRDMVEWVYGSAFPKSRNIGKDMEKIAVGGIKNLKQIGSKQGIKCETGSQGYSYNKEYVAGKCMGGKQISGDIPVYEINNEWEGWGTALKPAHEPICLARKPLAEKTVAQNVLKYGTGGINIDKSRVGTEDTRSKTSGAIEGSGWGTKGGAIAGSELGRFPANLIHDGSDEVVREFPQTGKGSDKKRNRDTIGSFGMPNDTTPEYNDSGSASRFFKSFLYCPKASKSERDRGCEGMDKKGNIYMARANGTGDVQPGMERFATQPKSNNHPTVKPLALMKYLIQMITPEGGVVLDPFAGSGSTLVAAKELGYDFIGIEMIPEYIPIIEARLSIEHQERLL